MRKLKNNNKGFTLIELLAVIVILAIILVIVVPKVFDVIDSSKKKALVNSAKGLADAWETKVASQIIEDDNNASALSAVGSSYQCITEADAGVLGISTSDYVIDDDFEFTYDNPDLTTYTGILEDTCSMVKMDENGKIAIILVAKKSGSIYTSSALDGTGMYASSDGYNSWDNAFTAPENGVLPQ